LKSTFTLEIGAGEHPHPDYRVHVDVLSLPGIDVVCRMDCLPFTDQSISSLRANDVLEHQSWELVPDTLREWARVLLPNAEVYVQVPDSLLLARRWVGGQLSTSDANFWILGGHSQRPAHRGVNQKGVPLWIYNAHHTLFDPDSLTRELTDAGFGDVSITSDGGSNIMCTCRRQ